MPLPDALKSLVSSRRFWTDFFWERDSDSVGGDGTPYPELESCELRLPVGDGFDLRLSFDQFLSYFRLGFVAPGQAPAEIAWDDQAHWHPHVLRWSELDTICRNVAAQDADLPHPGYPVLLLQRFAPICEGDDIEQIVAILETAWRGLKLFSTAEITSWIERNDARQSRFHWRLHDDLGWCIEQPDDRGPKGLYSLRTSENTEFPFADWQRMIASAEQQLAHRSGPATKLVTPVCFPREQHFFTFHIPHQDDDRPVPEPFSKCFNDSLHRVLRDLNQGSSEPSGAMCVQNADGTYMDTESECSLHLKGDLEAGLNILRGMLWSSKAPASVRLAKKYSDVIGWNLDQPDTVVPLVLQLGRLTTYRWNSGYRFDRVPFAAPFRQQLQDRLSKIGAIGPDEGGWFDMPTPDGGHLRLCAKHRDDDPGLDGITLVILMLTPQISEWVYSQMVHDEMMLLPSNIAPSDKVAEQIDTPCPSVHVVRSPSELHEIFTAGPYAWWIGSTGSSNP